MDPNWEIYWDLAFGQPPLAGQDSARVISLEEFDKRFTSNPLRKKEGPLARVLPRFREQYREGDEIVDFKSSKESWDRFAGHASIQLRRGGVVIATYTYAKN